MINTLRWTWEAFMHLRTALTIWIAILLGSTGVDAQTPSGATQAATVWPAKDGWVTLKDFRFGSGEKLAELKLHYITLGTPHRNTAGHVDNAVLLLHGTGGDAHSLMNPVFS